MQDWDVLSWLSEPSDQAVRYATLRRLLGRPDIDVDVIWARLALYAGGRVPTLLALQQPEGWWPGPHQDPTSNSYGGTAWQLMLLAELGATREHPQVAKGCEWLLAHHQGPNGDFPVQEGPFTKHKTTDALCLDAKTTWALLRMGYHDDPRVLSAVDYICDATLRANFRCHYQKSATRPCAFAAIKVLRMIAALPDDLRQSSNVQTVMSHAAGVLLTDDYLQGGRSPQWKRLGFPRGQHSDMLERAEVLVDLGYGLDPRLQPTLRNIVRKRQPTGIWLLEETPSVLPVSFERKGFPSKWITLRALYVLYKTGHVELSHMVRQQRSSAV